MNTKVEKPVRLGQLSMRIMNACPAAMCEITNNGWVRVTFEEKSWATIDVDNLCHIYAREDGWIHPDVINVVMTMLHETHEPLTPATEGA